ncbi:MAG: M23 family metallopeptidase [Myxococcota bacterium]|nr:M23 family metallopeptidase [Myxococcota bacterium]
MPGLALMVPVAGVLPEQVPDNFYAPRGGGRIHEATDIPAPRGTPVVSADDGHLLRIGRNRHGGNIIYATDPSGRFIYYYAHLEAFAAGLTPGQPVRRGDVLGTVGTTGNASAGHPHLHFQLMLRPSDGSIHGGRPLDARPYFVYPGRANQAWASIW